MTEVNAEIPTFSEATFADLRERQFAARAVALGFWSRSLAVSPCWCVVFESMACCLYWLPDGDPNISVRMAIGASAPSIVTMVVRDSLMPVTIGTYLGGHRRNRPHSPTEGVLFGIPSRYLWLFGAATVFVLVAAAAAALPARSA